MLQQSVRRVEDEVSHLAKTLAENYFDSDLTTVFNDLVVQMYATPTCLLK